MKTLDIVKKAATAVGTAARFAMMAGLVFVLWLISLLIPSLIDDRSKTRDEAEENISSKWGNEQFVKGPVLVVPFKEWSEKQQYNENGEAIAGKTTKDWVIRKAYLLPESVEAVAELVPEVRSRGIFETVVYVSRMTLKGRFKAPDFKSLGIDPSKVDASQAFLSLGIADPRGIREDFSLSWDGKPVRVEPSSGVKEPWELGVHAKLGALPAREIPFEIKLVLNGSRRISFLPVGRDSRFHVSSPWPSPSFEGQYLPLSRTVSNKGFEADWQILELARTFPQGWKDGEVGTRTLEDSGLGVKLIKTANAYQQNTRATKYAVLFILLTFTAFFLFETMGGIKVHPIQYFLVGSALVVFYLLLLSLSEHWGFEAAYLVSTVANMALISVYVHAVFKSVKRTALLSGLLAGLYLILFAILRLEDYALLIGSLCVFGALATTMLLTRKIDWYGKPR